MNDMVKNLLLWLVIAAVLLAVFQSFYKETAAEQLDYSDFIEQVRADRIREVTIEGLKIESPSYTCGITHAFFDFVLGWRHALQLGQRAGKFMRSEMAFVPSIVFFKSTLHLNN